MYSGTFKIERFSLQSELSLVSTKRKGKKRKYNFSSSLISDLGKIERSLSSCRINKLLFKTHLIINFMEFCTSKDFRSLEKVKALAEHPTCY